MRLSKLIAAVCMCTATTARCADSGLDVGWVWGPLEELPPKC